MRARVIVPSLLLLGCGTGSTAGSPGGSSDGSVGADGASVGTEDSGADNGGAGDDGGAVDDSGLDDAADGGSMPGSDAAPEASSGILVTANIQWDNIPQMHVGNAMVIVQDPMRNQLDGATVVVTPLGGAPLTAVSTTQPGVYNVALTSLSAAYDVSVTQTLGSRAGLRVVSPAEHTVTLTAAPTAATALPITWAPSGDPHVAVDVRVQCSTPFVDWIAQTDLPSFDSHDTGAYTIPAGVFPASGSCTVFVTRTTSTNVPAGFIGLVTITTGVAATL